MSSSDPHLDAQLRVVPLPDGLLERLRAIALAEDEGLDAALRDVALPEGLLDRLRHVPLAEDEGLDAMVRDVPVPSRLVTSWRRRAQRRDRLMRLSRLTVAVSLVIALTLTYFSAMLLSLAIHRWPGEMAGTPLPKSPAVSPAASDALAMSWASETPRGASGRLPPALPPEVGLAKVEEPRRGPAPTDLGHGLGLPPTDDPLARPSQGVLGYNSFDELPELPKRVADLVPRGLDWPLVTGSNRAFLIRYGTHPFVSPAAHPRLQSCAVPLAIDTGSYELARRYLEDGELPPPDLVRTEEFLAAVDYEYPRPEKQELGLVMAAGPSSLSGEGFCLLQVGVQARQTVYEKHAPVQLILVVDNSASMRWGGRIEILRRALKDLGARLDPADRLSLVSFNQGAHVLVQDLGPGQIDQFLAAVDSLCGEGSTDVAAALREAYVLAQQMAVPGRPPLRVVLATDGLLELDRLGAERIEHQVAEASRRGIPLQVIDLGQQKQGDPQVAAFARAGSGTVHRATSADQVRWALREIVTGRSQLVARDARLQVTFNPKTVLEYRLLGHEAKEWAGMLPGSVQADFFDGQSATALFEVRLSGSGPAEVATAELTWYPASGGKAQAERGSQRTASRLDRKDVAVSWAKTAPSLQEAAVVAQTAEILRRSPLVLARVPRGSTTAGLMRAWEMSGQVDSRVYQRPSFSEFVALIEQAIKAKPARSGVRRS